MKRTTLIALAALAVLLCGAVQANAQTITYSISQTASGTLGTTPFTDDTVTLTLAGDTSNVVLAEPGLWTNEEGTATVSVDGIGTATVNGFVLAADYQYINPSFAALETEGGILATVNDDFSTYNLQTAIGPLSGDDPYFEEGFTLNTTAGELTLNSVGANSTFTAITETTTPEPGSLMLMGTALVGLAMLLRRRLL
ncbi:MAG: PEP-CTERM sorting domain-containing protein [Terriglobia bacterium]